jgi:hypothetical protein
MNSQYHPLSLGRKVTFQQSNSEIEAKKKRTPKRTPKSSKWVVSGIGRVGLITL